MATIAGNRGGLRAFLAGALAPMLAPRMAVPVIVLAVVLTASNIVILLNMPSDGRAPFAFVAAAVVRVVGLIVLAVGILRLLNASPRPAWRPDAGFWAYLLTFLLAVALAAVAGALVGDRSDLLGGVAIQLFVTVLMAPLTAWFVALAVVRPLAWKPWPWLRAWSAWLPHFLFWSLLAIAPAVALHTAIGMFLIEGAGRWFWPLALIDGPLSVVIAVTALALGSEAYRRVAHS